LNLARPPQSLTEPLLSRSPALLSHFRKGEKEKRREVEGQCRTHTEHMFLFPSSSLSIS
ncbi:uncharacterized, partial [Tachysurus ichikawai]